MGGLIRTQIQLNGEQLKALKKRAEARHVSLAELVRQAVDAFIRTGAVSDPEERRKRAVAAAGRFRSGVSDLSSAHDKYFAKTLDR